MSVIVDYGNYYRDLRESIIKAKRSLFILGWDIDSRIELLRGKDAEGQDIPVTFYELICWKAKNDPDLQIYLNKWDYSYFFMKEREPFWEHQWEKCGLPNIHCCLDDVLPLGACHHHVHNEHRADPGPLPNHEHAFGPYHDIQAVMSGPAARALAQLARERWTLANTKSEPVPIASVTNGEIPDTWPDTDPPDFYNVDMAIARTIPPMNGKGKVEEIYQLYIDEIARAEYFIYIENQFLVFDEIAIALNKRMRERPHLRVLAVSSRNAQGVMESRSMYANRLRFLKFLQGGGMEKRSAIVYPVCKEGEEEISVRIHSKLMIIDDRLLHIGSSNINNRSMGMDTECDCVLIGNDTPSRNKIAAIRNDLIREHAGFTADQIQKEV